MYRMSNLSGITRRNYDISRVANLGIQKLSKEYLFYRISKIWVGITIYY